jgi:CelD/BcsL family acetyltransferase involved in cellulose biosynthesis
MLQARLISPSELSAREEGHWRALQGARAEFRSPLMGPDFARIVGRVRSDAAVLVLSRDGGPVGFLPHHRRPFGRGRPLGSPFADLHGLISRDGLGLDAASLLGHARLASFHFSGLVDPFGVFAGATAETRPSWFVSGAGAFETVREARKAHFKKRVRRERSLAAAMGAVEARFADRRAAALETVFAWKRAQLKRTGLHDFLRPAWTRALMDLVFESPLAHFVTLEVGGVVVAGRFGLAADGVCHPWITAYDPSLAYYSPGNILLWKFLEAMPALGLHTYDMGPGGDHDKALYATGSLSLGLGAAPARPRALPGALGQVRQRLEQIAEIELSDLGRIYGLAAAVAAQAKRSFRRHGHLEPARAESQP